MSKRYWNYRVIRFTDSNGETYQAIHEVYYENDKPVSFAENEAVVLWDVDDENVPRFILERMMLALTREVLTEKDFGSGS